MERNDRRAPDPGGQHAGATPHFFGRARIVRDMVTGLLAPQPGSFSLVGSKLVGKSRLLDFLASDDGPLLGEIHRDLRPYAFADAAHIVVLKLNCDWPEAQANFLDYLARRLQHHLREVEQIQLDWRNLDAETGPGRRIWTMARQLNQQSYRLILLLDNFDSVFANQLLSADAIDELRPLTLEMALVVATEQPLHDLDRELAASPLFNVMTQLFVGLLEPEAARRWLQLYAATYSGLDTILDELTVLTGNHPFLLERVDDILAELQAMLPPGGSPLSDGGSLNSDVLPLIGLRLAEHGRLLFATYWRMLSNPPRRMESRPVQPLLTRLHAGSLPMSEVTRELFPVLNWLINQAVVTFDPGDNPPGYRLFSPLFAEFLAARPITRHAASVTRAADERPDPDGKFSPDKRAEADAPSRAAGEPRPHALSGQPEAPIFGELTKTESLLLRYFQARSREVVSPGDLLEHVWKRPDASPRRVQEAIRRLRLQLADAEPPVGVIENERGRGYRFVPAA
ncbi:MAG: helix-turn-helix domain-containing protein [Litorilinea sp.]